MRANLYDGNVIAYDASALCRALRRALQRDGVRWLDTLLASPSVEFNVASGHASAPMPAESKRRTGTGHTGPFMFMEAGPFAGITDGNYPA